MSRRQQTKLILSPAKQTKLPVWIANVLLRCHHSQAGIYKEHCSQSSNNGKKAPLLGTPTKPDLLFASCSHNRDMLSSYCFRLRLYWVCFPERSITLSKEMHRAAQLLVQVTKSRLCEQPSGFPDKRPDKNCYKIGDGCYHGSQSKTRSSPTDLIQQRCLGQGSEQVRINAAPHCSSGNAISVS